MVRTQIQLTDEQTKMLKKLSQTKGKSMAELIRNSIEAMLVSENIPNQDEIYQKAISAGRISIGSMRKIKLLINTPAILAFLNANDDFHEKAVRIWNTILNPEHLLFCNNYILIETYSILQRRFGMEVVHTFYQQVTPVFEVLWITQDIHKRVMSAFLAANRRNPSFVDCTGFESMRSNSISTVFTFDHHYLEQSFEVIPAMK